MGEQYQVSKYGESISASTYNSSSPWYIESLASPASTSNHLVIHILAHSGDQTIRRYLLEFEAEFRAWRKIRCIGREENREKNTEPIRPRVTTRNSRETRVSCITTLSKRTNLLLFFFLRNHAEPLSSRRENTIGRAHSSCSRERV